MRLNPAAEGVRAASRVGGLHADVAVEDGHDAVVLAAAADWQPVGVSCAQRNQPLTSIEDTAALELEIEIGLLFWHSTSFRSGNINY